MTDPATSMALQNVQTSAGFGVLHNVLDLQAITANAFVQSLLSAGEPPHLGNLVDARA
ncbi:putative motility protein [bacterium]|nr:MAG: putative motility protein [bacterium]